jgi:hypothetical protein
VSARGDLCYNQLQSASGIRRLEDELDEIVEVFFGWGDGLVAAKGGTTQ